MGESVLIAVPIYSDMIRYAFAHHCRLIIGTLKRRPDVGLDVMVTEKIGLPYAHLRMAQRLLRGSYSHIFFLEEDMAPEPHTLTRLLEHQLPAVGALYFGRDPGAQPMMFSFGSETQAPRAIRDWEPGSLVAVDWTGLGCVLLHRSVFEQIGIDVFSCEGMFADDKGFFRRVAAAGFPVAVDTGVICGHLTANVTAVGYKDFTGAEEKLRRASTLVVERKSSRAT